MIYMYTCMYTWKYGSMGLHDIMYICMYICIVMYVHMEVWVFMIYMYTCMYTWKYSYV